MEQKTNKSEKNKGNAVLHGVMPRIQYFIDDEGYKYDPSDNSIVIEINYKGELSFKSYIADSSVSECILHPVLYEA